MCVYTVFIKPDTTVIHAFDMKHVRLLLPVGLIKTNMFKMADLLYLGKCAALCSLLVVSTKRLWLFPFLKLN